LLANGFLNTLKEVKVTRTFKKGDRVKAFHPGKFGVVNEGVVISHGSKFARIDFGELGGGICKVLHDHVIEVIEQA
jgi:hypothetical protein